MNIFHQYLDYVLNIGSGLTQYGILLGLAALIGMIVILSNNVTR